MKRKPTQTPTLRTVLVLTMAVLLVVSAGATSVVLAASTQVAIAPASQSVDAGSTTTVDVVATQATEGVGSYEFTISVDDPTVASITGVDLAGDPDESVSDSTIAADGSSATVAVFASDTTGTGEIVLATVTVTADAAGTATFSVDDQSVNIGTDAAEDYDITGTSDATVTVGATDDLSIEQAVASADSNGDDTVIEISELQLATNWWATETAVPDTGGETIDLPTLQALTNTWATGGTVSTPASMQITGTTVDGSNVTVTWDGTKAMDTDHVHVQLDDNDYVGGQPIDGSYTFENVAAGEHTVTVTVADMVHTEYTNPEATDTATVTVAPSLTSSSLVEVTPDSTDIDQTTYGFGSYQVTNTGETDIVSVSFDLSTASMPDMVFDPDGTAGDPTGEGLNIVSDGGTGITTAGGGSDEAFSQPHNGVDGDDGYDVMTVEFSDFQPGETATFWADNDPTSIKGATVSSQEAGPVSGLELARSTVTVTYADGTTQTATLMGDGSVGGSTAVLDGEEAPAPTIGVDGVSLDGSVLDGYHSGAVVSEAAQTVTVTGEPGETVTLVRVEGELSLSDVPNGGYDIEALEANNAVNVEYISVTLDGNGAASVPVTLTNSPDDSDEAGFNYFVAAHGVASGDMGDASNVVVLKYEESSGPTEFYVNSGGAEYTATDSTTYAADVNFVGGTPFASDGLEIAGTDDDTLYQTERYGTFEYAIPVANGAYDVTLHFAEIYHGVQNGNGVGAREFDVAIEGQQVLDNYDIVADVGSATATTKTYTADVTDGELNIQFTAEVDQAKVSAIGVAPSDGSTGPGSADIVVNANGGIDASTFNGGSFSIENTGDQPITAVSFDLSESAVPDAVFDPTGTAGDATAKGLVIDSESGDGVGVVSTADGDVFSQPHNGVDGTDGYDVLTIEFGDFQPGEVVTFSTDIDPTTIQGASTTGGAGSVSGLELAGSAVSVSYGDGATQTTDLFGDGSAGGAQATAKPSVPSAPALGVQDVTLAATDFPSHEAATVGDTAQTLTLSGPADGTVQLIQMELSTPPSDGYDIDPYEGDNALAVNTQSVPLDANGEATVSVTLSDTNLNYFVAAVQDGSGDTGVVSNTVILEVGDVEPQILYRVNAGETTTVAATDDGPDWTGVADTGSPYLVSVASSDAGNYCAGDNITAGSTVPSSTPDAVFDCERYGEMTWEFSVDSGQTVDVRLYFGNSFDGASEPGDRQFNVSIEGQQILEQYDPVADVGHATGVLKSVTVTDDGDGTITVVFEQGAFENPEIRAIEIIESGGSA